MVDDYCGPGQLIKRALYVLHAQQFKPEPRYLADARGVLLHRAAASPPRTIVTSRSGLTPRDIVIGHS
jgi:hypothetical protein